MQHDVHYNESIDLPFARVRAALLANPAYVFRHAPAAPATNTAVLHVPLGPIDLSADVDVRVVGVEQEPAGLPAMRILVSWCASRHRALFPTMDATINIAASSPTQTRFELIGHHVPPLGRFGRAFDAILGRRLAQRSIVAFVHAVTGWLLEELAITGPARRASS